MTRSSLPTPAAALDFDADGMPTARDDTRRGRSRAADPTDVPSDAPTDAPNDAPADTSTDAPTNVLNDDATADPSPPAAVDAESTSIEAGATATPDRTPPQDDDDRSLMPLPLLLGGLGLGALGVGAAGGGGGGSALGAIAGGGGATRPSLDGWPSGPGGDPSTSPSGGGAGGTGHRPAEAVLGLQVFAAGTMPDGTPLTRDGTVRVQGLEPDARWSYSFDGGATWHPGDLDRIPGSEAAKAGGDGRKSVLVYQTDLAGNDSPQASLVFELDQTPPEVPTLRLKHDTGSSATDRWTSDPTIEILGLDPTATLTVAILDEPPFEWQAAEIPASRFAGLEGLCRVVATQVDAAGNSASATLDFWLDTTAPLAPQLVLATTPDSGAVLAG